MEWTAGSICFVAISPRCTATPQYKTQTAPERRIFRRAAVCAKCRRCVEPEAGDNIQPGSNPGPWFIWPVVIYRFGHSPPTFTSASTYAVCKEQSFTEPMDSPASCSELAHAILENAAYKWRLCMRIVKRDPFRQSCGKKSNIIEYCIYWILY